MTAVTAAIQAGRAFEKQSSKAQAVPALNLAARIQGGGRVSGWHSAAVNITASSADKGLCVLARGRRQAGAELKHQAAYDQSEFDRFLSSKEDSPPRKMRMIKMPAETPEVCHSPCHFANKYGRKPWMSPRRLEPLLNTPREAGVDHSDTLTARRARANHDARHACWGAAVSTMRLALDEASRGHDAAAAV